MGVKIKSDQDRDKQINQIAQSQDETGRSFGVLTLHSLSVVGPL